jgi:hypothetical protein
MAAGRRSKTYSFDSFWWLFAEGGEGRNPMLGEYLHRLIRIINGSMRDRPTFMLKRPVDSSGSGPRGESATNDLSPIWSICRNTIGRSSQALQTKSEGYKALVK